MKIDRARPVTKSGPKQPDRIHRQKWDHRGVCWTYRSTVDGGVRATSYREARTFTRLEWAKMSSKRP